MKFLDAADIHPGGPRIRADYAPRGKGRSEGSVQAVTASLLTRNDFLIALTLAAVGRVKRGRRTCRRLSRSAHHYLRERPDNVTRLPGIASSHSTTHEATSASDPSFIVANKMLASSKTFTAAARGSTARRRVEVHAGDCREPRMMCS
jgi:hypothetical protein